MLKLLIYQALIDWLRQSYKEYSAMNGVNWLRIELDEDIVMIEFELEQDWIWVSIQMNDKTSIRRIYDLDLNVQAIIKKIKEEIENMR